MRTVSTLSIIMEDADAVTIEADNLIPTRPLMLRIGSVCVWCEDADLDKIAAAIDGRRVVLHGHRGVSRQPRVLGAQAGDAVSSSNAAGSSEPACSPYRVPEADRQMIFHVCQKLAVVLGLNAQEQSWLQSLGATFEKANKSMTGG